LPKTLLNHVTGLPAAPAEPPGTPDAQGNVPVDGNPVPGRAAGDGHGPINITVSPEFIVHGASPSQTYHATSHGPIGANDNDALISLLTMPKTEVGGAEAKAGLIRKFMDMKMNGGTGSGLKRFTDQLDGVVIEGQFHSSTRDSASPSPSAQEYHTATYTTPDVREAVLMETRPVSLHQASTAKVAGESTIARTAENTSQLADEVDSAPSDDAKVVRPTLAGEKRSGKGETTIRTPLNTGFDSVIKELKLRQAVLASTGSTDVHKSVNARKFADTGNLPGAMPDSLRGGVNVAEKMEHAPAKSQVNETVNQAERFTSRALLKEENRSQVSVASLKSGQASRSAVYKNGSPAAESKADTLSTITAVPETETDGVNRADNKPPFQGWRARKDNPEKAYAYTTSRTIDPFSRRGITPVHFNRPAK